MRRTRTATGLVTLAAVVAPGLTALAADEVQKSVVKVFASQSPPNMFMPWKITTPNEVTGSGVILEGGRILTNAHVVNWAQQIYVQPYESSDKLDAEIEWLSPDCDLATLKLDDPADIQDLEPVPLSDKLPELKAKINVLGYPTGGDTLSVTEGVVSRVEYSPYYYDTSALRIQVDAAVNPGNSGGPGIIDGQIAGIVFSKFPEGENIGYLIPAEVVRHFLDDWKDGKYDGFPRLRVRAATLENPDMRAYLQLDRATTGSLIFGIDRPDLKDVLKVDDVVLEVDGVAVDNLGMVPIASGHRVHMGYLITRKPAGSKVQLKIFRKGEKLDLDVATVTTSDSFIQPMTGKRPTYFIFGGLVFAPVTTEMVQAAGGGWWAYIAARGGLLSQYMRKNRENKDDEVVVACSPIIPHKLTKGYGVTPMSVLTHVNDQPVRNLRQMIKLIQDCKDEFIILRFENDWEEKIVLSPKRVAEHMPEILANNNIPAAWSDDLKDICK
ncbi:MAG: trypsin-like peptidase domain-containing protein [Planctomycetes bacterium]|nr:trypsin-like peptidase domain-containing protein [Planctomycetota bacterium]